MARISVALNPGDPATTAETSTGPRRRRRFAARPRPLHPRDRPEAGVMSRIESIFRPSAAA